MSVANPAIGSSWEDVQEEVMGFFTAEERARMDANVEALGGLLDALDAGKITQAEFDAAFDKLESPVKARRRPVAGRRAAVRSRVPKVAL